MAPPKGNKYALGNEGGRPIEWDKLEMARELMQWAENEESINLNGFCAYMGMKLKRAFPADYLLRWAKESDEFCSAYNYTKSILGDRRERKLNQGKLHVKAYDLNSTVYDVVLKAEKLEMMREEAKIAAEDISKVSEDLNNGFSAISNQLSTLQEASKQQRLQTTSKKSQTE